MAIEYSFDPIEELDLDIPRNKRREALEAAAELIKTEMLDYIGAGKSPVTNGKWERKLTDNYKKKKGEESSAKFSNLELTGEFLDSLIVDASSREVTISVGEDQQGKAEAFLTGQYGSGEMAGDYRREFMPQGNESFKRPILSKLKLLLSQFED